MEKRTGCVRCHTSRVENGHTVPTVETLEKYARALEVPMYQLFYEGNKPPEKPKVQFSKSDSKNPAGSKSDQELRAFAKLLSRMDDNQRKPLFATAAVMARANRE